MERRFGKPLLFLTVVVGELAAGVAAWRVAERVVAGANLLRRDLIASATFALGLVLFTVALVLTTAADLGSQTSWFSYVLAILVSSAVYGLVTSTLVEADAGVESDRRGLLLRLPVLVLGAASFYLVGSRILGATIGGLIVLTNGRTLLASFGVAGNPQLLAYAALLTVWAVALLVALRGIRAERGAPVFAYRGAPPFS